MFELRCCVSHRLCRAALSIAPARAKAGAVLAEGGQVMEIVGDAVLGIFPLPKARKGLAARHAAPPPRLIAACRG